MNKAREFFNNRAKNYGYDVKTLDWSSKRSQYIRFEILKSIGNLDGKSILDIGCGFADFYSFLKNNNLNFIYKGIDISEEIVSLVNVHRPKLDAEVRDILKDGLEQNYDFIFGSGIHYIDSGDNYDRMYNLLNKMYLHSNIGVGTNFIKRNSEYKFGDHVFTYEFNKVIDICEKITPFWHIRTDYLDNDVTLFLYKKDFGERANL